MWLQRCMTISYEAPSRSSRIIVSVVLSSRYSTILLSPMQMSFILISLRPVNRFIGGVHSTVTASHPVAPSRHPGRAAGLVLRRLVPLLRDALRLLLRQVVHALQ